MARGRLKATLRGLMISAAGWGMLFSNCTALIKLPGGHIDVNDDNVFVDLPGLLIDATDDRVFIDLPGIEVDVQGDFHHHHGDGF